MGKRLVSATTRIAQTMRDLKIVWHPPAALRPNAQNPRTHSPKQITKLAQSLRTFGFVVPVLVDRENKIVAGHGRVLAAQQLELERVPTISQSHLSETQIRAYAIADNRLAELAGWDKELLRGELDYIATLEIEFDLTLTGFETAEIDLLMNPEHALDPADAEAEIHMKGPPVSRPGDLWLLDPHRLLCGDARIEQSYTKLLENQKAQLVFTDAPYNVPIQRHARSLGRRRHAEFAMASGEMSETEFTRFLTIVLGHLAAHSVNGAIHYHCMDWRGLYALLSAGRAVYSELKNLCVWNKQTGGMGSLYRSQHELVAVFKVGTSPHINNIELGKHGRYRTNVWDHPSLSSFRPGRTEALDSHPTPKPVALVADAIHDCSKRSGLVLDAFAGSGTILIAAERTGRRAAALELDPQYVDGAIARFRKVTGIEAKHVESGLTLKELRVQRGRSDIETCRMTAMEGESHV